MTESTVISPGLPPLPPQPTGVAWPTRDWPVGGHQFGAGVEELLDTAFDPDGPLRETYAVAVVHGGRLVYERYGGTLPRWEGGGTPVAPSTPLLSWSMAKAVLHAAVGMLVGDGRLDPAAPAAVPSWQGADDPRGAITLDDLLEMRDGLDFAEEYDDAGASDVIPMLFGPGKSDMAGFAADRPLTAPPGDRFNYSTGTSMVISGIVARTVGPGPAYQEFLDARVFGPLGMASARATFDDAGSWVACGCCPRDGWTGAGRPDRSIRTAGTSTELTGGPGTSRSARSGRRATTGSTSTSARRSTWCSCGWAGRIRTAIPSSVPGGTR
ncbi:MAG: serine hydrolase [Acidimicrobiales bacterium]